MLGRGGPGDHLGHSPSSDVTLELRGSWGSLTSQQVFVMVGKDPCWAEALETPRPSDGPFPTWSLRSKGGPTQEG